MDCLVHMFPLTSEWLEKKVEEIRFDICSQGDQKVDEIIKFLMRHYSSTKSSLLLVAEFSEMSLPLLFQCAVSYGSEGKRVTFIRNQPLNHIPISVHGMPQPEATILKNVKFVYQNSVTELTKFCASIHTQTIFPDAIIVDNLDFFTKQSKDSSSEQSLTKLCCLLMDATFFIQKKSGRPVPLIMSTENKVKNLDFLLWRFPLHTAYLEEVTEATGRKNYHLSTSVKEDNLKCGYEVKDNTLCLTHVQLHVTQNDQPP